MRPAWTLLRISPPQDLPLRVPHPGTKDLVSAIRRRLCVIRPSVMYRIHRIDIDTHYLPSAAATAAPSQNRILRNIVLE